MIAPSGAPVNGASADPLILDLRTLRINKDKSTGQAARQIGCSPAAISCWERHLRAVTYRYVRKVADYYGIAPEQVRAHNKRLRELKGVRR